LFINSIPSKAIYYGINPDYCAKKNEGRLCVYAYKRPDFDKMYFCLNNKRIPKNKCSKRRKV